MMPDPYTPRERAMMIRLEASARRASRLVAENLDVRDRAAARAAAARAGTPAK